MLNIKLEAMKDKIEKLVNEYGIDIENEAEFIEDLLNLHNVSSRTDIPKPCVSNISSFDKIKAIWETAEKHVKHELGEICKGDANYDEHTPDLNEYYVENYC